MTRDEQIESFAIASTASWLERNTPLHGLPSDGCIDRYYGDAEACAEMALEARDRLRAARQPAPETPRIKELREAVSRECHYLWMNPRMRRGKLAEAWAAYDAEVISQYSTNRKDLT